jgi:single-stranded-DNA-specific exonuclease
MEKRWLIRNPPEESLIQELSSTLKIDEVLAHLLLQRGISSYDAAYSFFRPKLEDAHDPFLMTDMRRAVDRLNQAIANSEKILLFGDYDVDGTTAVALLFSYLKKHYASILFYIPDRYKEGYGVSFQGIDHAEKMGCTLIISLDCGIRSLEHVAYAREKEIDFIVCDHHQPGDSLPDCIVLNPKRADCAYPYKELSGCGVGFKLLQAFVAENGYNPEELNSYLDLLALSIGADIVPITGENRIFCFHGLARLNERPRKAFQELLQLAKKSFPVSLTDIVFTIAPRINAAGRLYSGKTAVELMISEDMDKIHTLAAEIDRHNKERRALDEEITAEAMEMIEANNLSSTAKSFVLYHDQWHKGVVGIVASRIVEKHYKPTIVLAESNGLAAGSARTVANFDLYQALCRCEALLEQFGGHTHAAGLTLKIENVEAFQKLFEEVVQENLPKEDEAPELSIDMEMDFNKLFEAHENRMKLPRMKRILEQFEPHGPGNMKPVFLARNVFAVDCRVLKDEHLKLSVTQPQHDIVVDAIAFNMASKVDEVAAGVPFDMIYTLEKNVWNNRETLQLNVKDIRSSI